MKVIEIDQLTKMYSAAGRRGPIVALDAVSFSVSQGEIFALLGQNGAGKTTLVRTVLGLTSITSGSILLNGYRPQEPASREKVGFLGENYRFPGHLSGDGLLRLTGRMYGMPETQIDERIGLLLPLVGMEKWADTKISKYSKGMTQRVGLAQAMLPDPDLIILDEPTDGVDPIGRVEIRTILEKIRSQGKTILINSHLLAEVESLADRVAILVKGRLARINTVAELTRKQNEYRIEAAIGDQLLQLPPEIGKLVSITATEMIAELISPQQVSKLIDLLRTKGIAIYSVTPIRISLEQSFLETVGRETEYRP